MRTAHATRNSQVKLQPQWLQSVFEAMKEKRSNLQFGIGAVMPYGDPKLHTTGVLDAIAGTWIACRPWIKTILASK
jgi:hypothetical protein